MRKTVFSALLSFVVGGCAFFGAAKHGTEAKAAKRPAAPVTSERAASAKASVLGAKSPDVSRTVFKSDKPLYVKVAVNEDRSKILLVAFDESEGTGKGYDVLYADIDFDGRLEPEERLKAADRVGQRGVQIRSGEFSSGLPGGYPAAISLVRPGPAFGVWSFPPISVDVPYNEHAKGVVNPCRITFRYQKIPNVILLSRWGYLERNSAAMQGVDSFSLTVDVRLRQGPAEWQYTFGGEIKPSEKPEDAPVWGLADKPQLQVTTRPDGRNKGNVGIGLKLVSGVSSFECKKDDKPVEAHVEIRDSEGKTVHQGSGKLAQFRFG